MSPFRFLLQQMASPRIGQLILSCVILLNNWMAFYSNVSQNRDYVASSAWREKSEKTEMFDFIIVGGGSAGSVLANRLSQHNTVLLLELGGDPNPISELGASQLILQQSPSTALLYETLPQKNCALGFIGQKVQWPRGVGLGGSSSINGQMYQRGNPNDYDNWANITGDPDWSYRNVLKYLMKLEDYDGNNPNAMFHGTGGPIRVEKDKLRTLEKYWFKAAREKGFPITNMSPVQREGFHSTEFTMKNGLRWSTFSGYLKPILGRSNLHIYRYARVVKVHLDRKRHAYGLTFIRHGQTRFVRAAKEIILSAGAIDSPKILMLSGIGPKQDLNKVGLKSRVNLPVGQNLQDHIMVMIGPFFLDSKEAISFSNSAKLETFTDFFKNPREGILATAVQSVQAFVSSTVRNDKKWPDIQFMPMAAPVFPGLSQMFTNEFKFKPGIMERYLQEYNYVESTATFVAMSLGRPKSVGTLKLGSRDPFVPPLIQPNYFSHPDDVRAMVEGAETIMHLVENTTAFASINANLIPHLFPGCEHLVPKSGAYFECFIRHTTSTTYHPVGTAAMGKNRGDNGAVVDSKLRVLKTTGLRVVDAAIMPVIPNANTNIPTIMIGEIGSDFIRAYWQLQYEVCRWHEYTFLYSIDLCYYSKLV